MTRQSDAILERLMQLHPKVIDLSLDRVLRLLDRLGRPQDRLPPVIHVAGTNGKGSVIAFLRAMLEAAGLRVHTYRSEEHTSELQSLMRTSYAVLCLQKKNTITLSKNYASVIL